MRTRVRPDRAMQNSTTQNHHAPHATRTKQDKTREQAPLREREQSALVVDPDMSITESNYRNRKKRIVEVAVGGV